METPTSPNGTRVPPPIYTPAVADPGAQQHPSYQSFQRSSMGDLRTQILANACMISSLEPPPGGPGRPTQRNMTTAGTLEIVVGRTHPDEGALHYAVLLRMFKSGYKGKVCEGTMCGTVEAAMYSLLEATQASVDAMLRRIHAGFILPPPLR